MTRAIAMMLLAGASLMGQTTLAGKMSGLEKQDGFFPLYHDARAGKLYLLVDKFDTEFLYYESLPAGLGSNDTGLDRGLLGREKVVHFERVGPKVLLVQENLDYRAVSDDAAERKAVADSFARSVLYGFTVEAEEGGKVLIDVTNFVVRDAMNVAGTLAEQKQGNFKLDAARSALYMARTKAFPKNTEMEATITFAGENVGRFVASVTPTAAALTLRVHQSFVELPPAGYQPRVYDPRSGYIMARYMDYATPVEQPIMKRFIARHRLEKKNPAARVSEAVKPIVYYVDRGAPEPIRGALLEGARWWNQAFEAIGYRNAFQVELMPEGADPMDARYNVIQWVHRSTRGWSYGASVTDPRTGEILKGHVTLGSLRIRQDFMIAEGMLAPYETADASTRRMMEMSLARIRQLSVHEVGHCLGLVHNFAASAFGRASVMDYPAPYFTFGADGGIDLREAYAVGIGEWDKVAIEYGYQHYPAGTNEAGELRKVIERANQRGLYLISDTDARAAGGAHPVGHLWDNGANAVDELRRMMKVRARALAGFGEKVIPVGTPLSELENRLVPIYLSHRYQLEAAVKVVGGVNYRYALRGGGEPVAEVVAAGEQRRALEALLETIGVEALSLPEALLRRMPPPAPGYERTRESFRGRTGLSFDALAPAEAAIQMVVGMLLHPQRASRLDQHEARDERGLGLREVIERLWRDAFAGEERPGMAGRIGYLKQVALVYHLMALAREDQAAAGARKEAFAALKRIEQTGAVDAWLRSRIRKFEEDPRTIPLPRPVEAPPGMPIGDEAGFLW
ncbi:MAG: zinc-dependent metalloprotease [Acidobacteriota bacterium]